MSRRRSRTSSTTLIPNFGFNNTNREINEKSKSPTSPSYKGSPLSSIVDVEYIPLAVDLCHWVAEQTASCLEIEQFITCMQDGIILCRLINAMSKMKCEKSGETFKLIHFRENIGNSVFFARINIETFIRWSKNFGVTDLCTVSDLVDLKDVHQAINNVCNVGRKCAELGLPHPEVVKLEIEHGMVYSEIVGLFDPAHGTLSKEEKAAKDGLINLMNQRGLGALRHDATLTEQLGNWRRRLNGKWAGTQVTPPTPEPLPPAPPSPPPQPIIVKKAKIVESKPTKRNVDELSEAKMGPWDNEEVMYLIDLYRLQIDEYGDDHIDFQRLSDIYTKRYKHRTPHQCWDKMYQLIERYQCDRSANRLFKRKVCSGPHHDQLHMCLGDTDLAKHLKAVYTGMSLPKAPAVPSYLECDSEDKASIEKAGREQMAEQNELLKSINEHLKAMREQAERNSSTNAALLVLLTHVLKGESIENGNDTETILTNANQGPTELKTVASEDSDSKSLASDTDIADKTSDN